MNRFKAILKDPLQMFLLVFPFIFGLYYEFAAYLAGICIAVMLIGTVKKQGQFCFPKTPAAIMIMAAYLLYGVSCFVAVDKGMAFAGLIKMLPIPLFLLLVVQYPKDYRQSLLEVIPYSGFLMLVISALLGLTEAFSATFYSEGRLGGFFQYSNTFALYLLIGCIVLLTKDTVFDKKVQIGGTVVFLAGIFMTGSRTVFVLFVIMMLFHAITQKPLRWMLVAVLGIGVALGVGLAVLTGTASLDTFARFLTIDFGQSTFVGRLIYYRDALSQIVAHPFGMGYMGYYYAQPSFQTAVYTVRYVHNDLLQIALDAGMLAAVLLAAGFLVSLFSKRTLRLQKEILFFVCGASLLDFHLQFIIMPIVLMLCVDIGSEKALGAKVAMAGITLCGAVFIWLFAAFFMAYMNNLALSLKLYPWNTDARIEQLYQAQTQDDAEAAADAIIAQNGYVADAYQVNLLVAAAEDDTEAVVSNGEAMLDNSPYELENYESYIEALSACIDTAAQKENWATVRRLGSALTAIPARLDAVRERTTPTAWDIDEKPELELPESYRQYIDAMDNALAG